MYAIERKRRVLYRRRRLSNEKSTGKTIRPSRLMLFVVDSTFVNPLSTSVLIKYDFAKFFNLGIAHERKIISRGDWLYEIREIPVNASL